MWYTICWFVPPKKYQNTDKLTIKRRKSGANMYTDLCIMFFKLINSLVLNPPTSAELIVASSYSGQNQSTACFDCWPKCAHRGIFDWFWLSFWPPWTIPDNAFTSQKQSTHFDLYMYKYYTWSFKCSRYTLASTLLKKIKGTWSAPSLVCGHSQVQLLEDMHNCTSLKSLTLTSSKGIGGFWRIFIV